MKKANNYLWMCAEFTNLNNTCPKANFPMLKINQLVDATRGNFVFFFMDSYSRYNQIKIYELDREMISFMINQGLFFYKVIPF